MSGGASGSASDGELAAGELPRPPIPPRRPARVAEAVAAARRIVEEHGLPALTMRRLADELGMQAPSLYKHFSGKAAVELAMVDDAMFELGDACHRALHQPGTGSRLVDLVTVYRRYCVAHPNLYRLATGGPLDRDGLTEGLEEWAGNPWFVVTGDPSLAQALWSFAHGMVVLEIDGRYPPGSDLDRTWLAGAAAFELVAAEASLPAAG